MKFLSLILSSLFVLSAQAMYVDTEPEASGCLEESAQSLLSLIADTKEDSRFELVYSKANLPEYIGNAATGEVYTLEGVWRTQGDEEFMQYGDDYEVFTALVQTEDSGACQIVHIDTAMKF